MFKNGVGQQLFAYLDTIELISVGFDSDFDDGNADCVPFAIGDFHNRFLKDHSIVAGCPKLDDSQFYIEKLAEILKMTGYNILNCDSYGSALLFRSDTILHKK